MTATEQSPLNLDPLEKAVDSLRDALAQPKTPYTRDATVHRFEYTFALAWKSLRRSLATETAVDAFSVKDVVLQAGQRGIIANTEAWLSYLKGHNTAPFADNEAIYRLATAFLPDVQALLNELRKRCDARGQ
jgi:nucleotidyltransferase substrate binding protein (TIGR01987 family)